MRTIVDLPEDQIRRLANLGEREHVSRAELIRRAVGEYLKHHEQSSTDAAFGLWRGRAQDGVAYQDALREEWR